MSGRSASSGSRFEWVFRQLLRLYPPGFRARFGPEMLQFYRLRSAEALRGRSFIRALRLSMDLALDLGRSLPPAWRDELRARRARHTATSAPLPPEDRMDSLLLDLRFALRSIARRPGFAAVTILTLALGIGANTAIFSVVNAVLLQPLPWPDAGRLMFVFGARGDERQQGDVYLDYLDWRRSNTSFETLGVIRAQSVNLTGGDTPDRLIGMFADVGALRTLHATVARGRLFIDSETEVATREPVAIISDALWRTRFGARTDLLGSRLVLNGQAFTVVGILPPNFQTPVWAGAVSAPDVWLPIGYYPNKGDLDTRGQAGVLVVGRLRPGVPVTRAQQDMDAITRRLAEEYPVTNAGLGANVQPLAESIVGPSRTPLLLVLAAVGIVLLVACANVANLQLARAAARRRELSVRAALGAGRGRLLRQLLSESVVLSLVGGAAGVALALAMVHVLAASIAPLLPLHASITLDGTVLLFALGATVLAGLLFGVFPAWQASNAHLHETLTLRGDAPVGAAPLAGRHSLIGAQIALCVVLLVSAGLLARSLGALAHVDVGFQPDHLLTLQFRLPPTKYRTDAQIASMFTATIAQIRAVPGVRAAALVRATPLNGNGETMTYAVEGADVRRAGDLPSLQLNVVSPGYFETMMIPRLAGRDFTMQDRDSSRRVAIVNAQLARKIAPGASAVGRQIRIGGDSGTLATVVGVVGDVKQFRLSEATLDQAYVSYQQRPLIFTEVVVRTTGDPMSVANAVRAAIWRVDRDQPVWGVRPVQRSLEDALGAPSLTVWVTASFALLALLLATIGVYGVMSYLVAQRTQEVGIRMALGAGGRQVLLMVVRQGMTTVVIALAIGVIAAIAATRLLASQLFGVGATDPLTFSAVVLLLAIVAVAACWIPARRASRVDPMVALRRE
ncbi:MAG TPA: ABC transporter permease [Gemmatimonadaceae bacterium]|nr:ABC transporter permease [Gemmatimonadaceae bacterium]